MRKFLAISAVLAAACAARATPTGTAFTYQGQLNVSSQAANASYDLRIVPAVPQFRNWTVTITCDNGTSTTATTYF